MTEKKASPPRRKDADYGTTAGRKIRRGGGNRKRDGKAIATALYGGIPAGGTLPLDFDGADIREKMRWRFGYPALRAFEIGRRFGRLWHRRDGAALRGFARGLAEARGEASDE